MVLYLALKYAGIIPHTRPATILHIIITAKRANVGIESPAYLITAAVAIPPTSICPSAPIFQKRILNAGVIARDTASSIIVSLNVFHVLLEVPIAPSIMPIYTSSGFVFVIANINTPHTIRASTIAIILIIHDFFPDISLRFAIRTIGSFFKLPTAILYLLLCMLCHHKSYFLFCRRSCVYYAAYLSGTENKYPVCQFQ